MTSHLHSDPPSVPPYSNACPMHVMTQRLAWVGLVEIGEGSVVGFRAIR